jgi:serine/threonine-protein kinase ATR
MTMSLMLCRDCFSQLNDADRCTAFEYLGMIPCAAIGSLTVTRDNEGKISTSRCFLCDGTKPPSSTKLDTAKCQTVCADALATFIKVIKSPAFAGRPRVLAMLALKRFTTHFQTPDFMDLMSSPLGQWCVASLNSSARELRIAAG